MVTQTQFKDENKLPLLIWAMGGTIQTGLNPYFMTYLVSHLNVSLACAVSPAAMNFVTLDTLRALSQKPVYRKKKKWHPITGRPYHLEYSNCDLLLVFPATARIIAESAIGNVTCPVTRLMAFTPAKKTLIVASIHPSMDEDIHEKNLKLHEECGRIVIRNDPIKSVWADIFQRIALEIGQSKITNPSETKICFDT